MKKQIESIVSSKELKQITYSMVEKALDNQITDDLLKEIPIMKTLVAVKNIYTTYTDKMFIKKAMNVLLELGDVNLKERLELTSELDDENSSGTEKILMAISHLETIEKCKVFGRLCKLKALNKINKEGFSRLTKLIQDAYLKDLTLVTFFKDKNKENFSAEEFFPLISLGLIFQKQSKPTPTKKMEFEYGEVPPEMGDSYEGGEIEFSFSLSTLGDLFLKHYNDLFPERD